MESSIAVFLKRWIACELPPTIAMQHSACEQNRAPFPHARVYLFHPLTQARRARFQIFRPALSQLGSQP